MGVDTCRQTLGLSSWLQIFSNSVNVDVAIPAGRRDKEYFTVGSPCGARIEMSLAGNANCLLSINVRDPYRRRRDVAHLLAGEKARVPTNERDHLVIRRPGWGEPFIAVRPANQLPMFTV